jgi:hypothetical protein
LRRYRADPSWEIGYRLLRLNERVTGELISRENLLHFARRHLILPFMQAITKLHEHEYRDAPIDEWDIWGPEDDSLQYNVLLQDDVKAYHEGFIPSISENPIKLLVTLILKDDVQYGNQGIGGFYGGFYGGARPWSTTFGRRVDGGFHSTLGSNTIYELRHHLRRYFRRDRNYDDTYIWGSPWGFQDVLPIPKSEWNPVTKTSEHNLILIYTFYPDQHLWNILFDLEFRV